MPETVIHPEDYEKDDEPSTNDLVEDASTLEGDPYGN